MDILWKCRTQPQTGFSFVGVYLGPHCCAAMVYVDEEGDIISKKLHTHYSVVDLFHPIWQKHFSRFYHYNFFSDRYHSVHQHTIESHRIQF